MYVYVCKYVRAWGTWPCSPRGGSVQSVAVSCVMSGRARANSPCRRNCAIDCVFT